MTPRTIDWRSVRATLRRIRELLDQLQAFGPVDVRRLSGEPVTELAIERVLTLLVDLAFACNSHVGTAILGHAPDSSAESFTIAAESGMITSELASALRPSVGMCNVLVHDDLETDRGLVAAAVPLALAQYGEYVRQVARFAADRAT